MNADETKSSGGKGLRWGILGAARVAERSFIPAARAVGHRIVAVASSSVERSRDFAERNAIGNVAENYAALVELEDIDAVYIPLTNLQHYQWARACAFAGKHCIVEKPMVPTAEEARMLRENFERNNCRLIEGFMWRHHPQTLQLLDEVSHGELGELRRMHCAFSFPLEPGNNFRWKAELGGGALWDLGCYCVNAQRLFFGEEPEIVAARWSLDRHAREVDETTVGWLDFGQGRMGTFECSFASVWRQELTLVGTEGTIKVRRPFIGRATESEIEVNTAKRTHTLRIPPLDAFEAMIEHFARLVADPSYALQPAEDGVEQALVMDALIRSAQLKGIPFEVKHR